jgi:hypothetical protein
MGGGLTGGASATVAGGGTIVGRLVSITIRSGHLCPERSRITVRSTSPRAGVTASGGRYQSVRNSSASNRLPIKTKYRPRGMPTTIAMTEPLSARSTGAADNGSDSNRMTIGKIWEKVAIEVRFDLREKIGMDRDVASAALVRVWHVYRLINLHVDENDARRTKLDSFLQKRRDAGVADVELLAVEGLKFLKRLDQTETGPPA